TCTTATTEPLVMPVRASTFTPPVVAPRVRCSHQRTRNSPPTISPSDGSSRPRTSRPLASATGPLQQLGDPHAELVVDHDDVAARHEAVVDEHVDGGAGGAVELHDAALAEAQQVADLEAHAPQLDGDDEVDVGEQVEVGRARVGGAGPQVGVGDRGDLGAAA